MCKKWHHEIISGFLIVLKARKIVANLFMLIGEVHHEEEASITSASYAKEMIIIWYKKLGYLLEKGMKFSLIRSYFLGLQRFLYLFMNIML